MSKRATSHGVFTTVRETDRNITVGAPAWDLLHRNRLDFNRQKLLAEAIRAYRLNPLVRRIVKLYRYFAIGTNVTVEVKEAPSGILKRLFSANKWAKTQRFIQEFWNHPINRMDEQIPEWFDERTLTGELYLLFSVDAAGMCLVRAVPAESITKIDTAENDYRQELAYHSGEMEETAYPAWKAEKLLTTTVTTGITEMPTSFMRHYVINRPVGSTWGESDLFPVLPWAARYTSWLENRATLNYWRQVFTWVLKGQYKNAQEREARRREIEARPPTPGSVLVNDETETWEAVSPKLDSFEAGADGLALKKHIAAGAGIPMHFLAEPESSTRTTAEAAGTPTFKNFADYQTSFFNILRDVLEIACEVRRRYDGDILPRPEIDIHGQDISERDNPALSLAFQRAVEAAGELYDRKMIDTREMLRTAYQFGGLMYDEKEAQSEGLRRPLSNRVKPNHPTPTPSPKTDPETSETVEASNE